MIKLTFGELAIMIIVLGTVFTSSALFIGDISNTFGVTDATANLSFIDKTRDISQQTTTMETQAFPDGDPTISDGILGAPLGWLKGAWKATKLIRDIPGLGATIFSDVAKVLNIPSWFVAFLSALLAVFILYKAVGMALDRGLI